MLVVVVMVLTKGFGLGPWAPLVPGVRDLGLGHCNNSLFPPHSIGSLHYHYSLLIETTTFEHFLHIALLSFLGHLSNKYNALTPTTALLNTYSTALLQFFLCWDAELLLLL